jgi:ABC-type sugar transport system ATPase subunit
MVRQPAVFLLDEPLSNLDARLRREMRRELYQLHHRWQTTMVYVTHDQTEAMTLGERIVVMNHGEIQQTGSPLDVYQRPRNRFVAEFVGTPPMSFLPGRVTIEDGKPRFEGCGVTSELRRPCSPTAMAAAKARTRVELGVRPEDVRLVPLADFRPGVGCAEGHVLDVETWGDAHFVSVEIAAGGERTKNSSGSPQSLIGKIDSPISWRVADPIGVAWNPQHTHLFDRGTGECLTFGNE